MMMTLIEELTIALEGSLSLSRNKQDAEEKARLIQKAKTAMEEHGRFQGDNPLKIVEWISHGELGPEPDTLQLFHEAGQILASCGALGAFGTVFFRCDNGKVYTMVVCSQICEADKKAVAEYIDEMRDDEEGPCDCELPGQFYSGVPGIIAQMEDGRLTPDAKVQRCDACELYESDEAAMEKLKELGLVGT
jgi:hypothetical protein